MKLASGAHLRRAMVERIEWFAPIHYEILGFFDEHDILISPRDLARNLEYDRNYTGTACRELAQAELVESHDGVYQLTARGRAFLAGDLDPAAIDSVTDS